MEGGNLATVDTSVRGHELTVCKKCRSAFLTSPRCRWDGRTDSRSTAFPTSLAAAVAAGRPAFAFAAAFILAALLGDRGGGLQASYPANVLLYVVRLSVMPCAVR